MIDIEKLSDFYHVEKLTENHIQLIYDIQKDNGLYYKYCPPEPSTAGVIKDMKALPPGKEEKDKYYIGFFQGSRLIAILDMIEGYPNEKTIFFGFFMVTKDKQGQGLGSDIIQGVLHSLKGQGFSYINLAYMKENPQSKAFWEKCRFVETGVETNNGQGDAVVLGRKL